MIFNVLKPIVKENFQYSLKKINFERRSRYSILGYIPQKILARLVYGSRELDTPEYPSFKNE
jgi:hypothetical protein